MYSVFAGLLPPNLSAMSTGYYLSGESSEDTGNYRPPIIYYNTQFYKPTGPLYDEQFKYGLLIDLNTVVNTSLVNYPQLSNSQLPTMEASIKYNNKDQIKYGASTTISYRNTTTSTTSLVVRIKKGRKNGTIFIKDNG